MSIAVRRAHGRDAVRADLLAARPELERPSRARRRGRPGQRAVWSATRASIPSSSASSQAALTPFTSETDGVYGNDVRPPSIQVSFQSSSERNEPRGAAGFARMRRPGVVADRRRATCREGRRGTSAGRRRRCRGPSRRAAACRSRATRRRRRSRAPRCASRSARSRRPGSPSPMASPNARPRAAPPRGASANARSTISGSTCAS